MDEFQKKKATLENKVQVSEQLRLAQKGSVHLLDEHSKALPEYLWLNNLDNSKGALKPGLEGEAEVPGESKSVFGRM